MIQPPSLDMTFTMDVETPVTDTLKKWRAFLEADPYHRKPTEMELFHQAIDLEKFLLNLVEMGQLTAFQMESIDIFGDVTFDLLLEPVPAVGRLTLDLNFGEL